MRLRPAIDFNVPPVIVGQPPANLDGETSVNAWGPFRVWLEDAEVQPAYIGSRLLFFWDRLSHTMMVRFFPAEPPSMKIYTVLDGGRDFAGTTEITEHGTLQFKTLEHGWCELHPIIDPIELRVARRACSLD